MDKLKRYIDLYIPTTACNLRCSYCYVTLQEKYSNKIIKISKTENEIKKAFSLERLGGKCLINLCADGETLLSADIIKVIRALLEEGHYLNVVTNGLLTERLKETSKFKPELLERLFFKFSFHYLELLRLNKLDVFFNNIKRIKEAGCSYTVELVPHDELIPYIKEIKKISMEKIGSLPHVTIARDQTTKEFKILSKYSFNDYKKIWKDFNSNLFNFKVTIFYKKRKEFCYAGDWSLIINLLTGNIHQCYGAACIGNIYDTEKPIKFRAVGYNCQQPHCYNGHAFLSLGVIPELNTPSYAVLRNRKTIKGDTWLTNEFKSFINQKLKDSNKKWSEKEKIKLSKHKKINIIYIYISRLVAKIKNLFHGF